MNLLGNTGMFASHDTQYGNNFPRTANQFPQQALGMANISTGTTQNIRQETTFPSTVPSMASQTSHGSLAYEFASSQEPYTYPWSPNSYLPNSIANPHIPYITPNPSRLNSDPTTSSPSDLEKSISLSVNKFQH